jgi:hypothetical protein
MLRYALLATVSIILADTAHAQCVVDNKKVFIDPRLVPQRPKLSREAFVNIMSNPYASPELKAQARQDYMNQFEPIAIPYDGGTVLISATNPCLQQFIPR